MAKDKKSFILYTDLKHTLDKLPDDVAGRLFKHILDYVNDLNPETDELLISVAFEPVKQQLKRDLRKYDDYIDKQRENGKKGGRPKKTQKTQPFNSKPKKADSVNDSVNDNDIYTNIPTCEEFISHALSKKADVCPESVRLKYEAWKVNGWKNGNDKPIKNWKSSLNNTLPYLNTKKTSGADDYVNNVLKQLKKYD